MARGLDHEVSPLPAGQLVDLGDRTAVGRFDDVMHAQLERSIAAQRQRVDQDHSRPHTLGGGGCAQADIAAARNQHGLRGVGAAVYVDRVIATREWLDQRPGLEADARRQPMQPGRPRLEILRIGAVDAEAEMVDPLAALDHAFAHK